MAFGSLTVLQFEVRGPPPANAEELAARIGEVIDPEIVRERVHAVTLFLSRGATLIRVELPVEASVDPSDLVRALAARWQATGLGLLFEVPPPPEAEADRAYTLAVEFGAEKVDRLLAIRLDAAGKPGTVRIMLRRHKEPQLVWLGVAPKSPIELAEHTGPPVGEA